MKIIISIILLILVANAFGQKSATPKKKKQHSAISKKQYHSFMNNPTAHSEEKLEWDITVTEFAQYTTIGILEDDPNYPINYCDYGQEKKNAGDKIHISGYFNGSITCDGISSIGVNIFDIKNLYKQQDQLQQWASLNAEPSKHIGDKVSWKITVTEFTNEEFSGVLPVDRDHIFDPQSAVFIPFVRSVMFGVVDLP